MVSGLSGIAAFTAGLLSFFSPCVLPLIPSCLSFLGGAQIPREQEEAPRAFRRRLVLSTLWFILGFTGVFILFSMAFYGSLLLMGGMRRIISILAGGLVMVLGLNMLFNFLPFLNYEKRLHPRRSPVHGLDSLLIGAAFGAGWTPCIGPILGSIIAMAGQAGNPGRAAAYLGLYALGLGIPFFLGAAFLGSFLGLIARARKHLALLRRVSALLVILIGAGIALGAQNSLNIALSRAGWALAAGESRLVPALVLGALALLPSAPALIRRKRPGTPALVCSGVLAVLAILQGLGIINGAGLLSRWLLFQGA